MREKRCGFSRYWLGSFGLGSPFAFGFGCGLHGLHKLFVELFAGFHVEKLRDIGVCFFVFTTDVFEKFAGNVD